MTAVNAVIAVGVDVQAEQALGDGQVAGAGDRQELGEPLDDSEQHGLGVGQVTHGGQAPRPEASRTSAIVRSVCRRWSRVASNAETVSVVTPASAYAASRSRTRSGGPISAVLSMSSQRYGGRRLAVLAVQVQVLHLGRGLVVAHPHGELVVEVLLPAAHAADVQRGVAADRRGAGLDVVADHDRARSARRRSRPSRPRRSPGRPLATGAQRRHRDLGVLGAEEDAEPAVGDLAGQLEVLRADRGQVDRDLARAPGARSA